MKVFLLATGSELLNFKVNQYSPILSQKLSKIGITLRYEMTVRDDLNDILEASKYALLKSDILIVIGGLGPTFDDHTRNAISKLTERKIVFSDYVANFFKKRYEIKKLKKNLINQCMVIENSILIENFDGTAFVEILEHENKIIILLPGPINEWGKVWEKVEKFLVQRFGLKNKINHCRFKIADIKETELEKILKPLIREDHTILAGPNICEFSIKNENEKIIKITKRKIEKLIKNNIYGYDDDTLEKAIGNILKTKNKTLSTAESCTGGLLSSLITDIPKSSSYYFGGINAYSNLIKEKILKVKRETLKKFGAVSKETAYEMAINVKKLFNTDYSISITGIAGPSGGNKKKPVGLVWFGISLEKNTIVEKRIFLNKDRLYIKKAATNTAMFLLYKMIK